MKHKQIIKNIELILIIISINIFLCYILGYIILNTYLYHLGFYEFNLLQTKYLSAGFSFLIINIFLFVLIYLIHASIKKYKKHIKNKKLRYVAREIFAFLVLIFYGILFYFFVISRIWDSIILNFLILLWFITESMLILYFYNNLRKKLYHINYLTLFIGFIILIYIYSLSIYPLLPSYFGGGRPFVRSIIASDEEITFFNKNFGIDKADNSNVQTNNLCLLYENYYVEIYIDPTKQGRIFHFYREHNDFKGVNIVIYQQKDKLEESHSICRNFFNGTVLGFEKMNIQK